MNFLKKVLRRLRNKPPKKAKNKQSTKCETTITEINECDSQNDYEEDVVDPQEYVDDLELGEEAWTFNLRQQIASMANHSTPQHMGSFYHQPTPSLSFFEKQGLPPLAPLIINNQPNVPGMSSMVVTPSFMGTVPPSPCSFNFSTQAAAAPGYYSYAHNPFMNYSPHSGPMQPYSNGGSYMGLSHMETLELHHLLANGISETEALQTIQNKRLLEAAHRACAVSAFPSTQAAGVSTFPGPVDGYSSADQSCNNHTDVMSRPPSAMLSKAHEEASCHLIEALEKADEDALQAAIAMSMKDANLSSSVRHQSPSMVQSRSNRFSNPPMSAPGFPNDHHSPRLVSSSGSKSSDLSSPSAQMGYNHYAAGGIAPEYCGHNQSASHAKSPRTVTNPYGQDHSDRQPSNCQPQNAAKMILARNQYPTQHHIVSNKSSNGDDSKHFSPRNMPSSKEIDR